MSQKTFLAISFLVSLVTIQLGVQRAYAAITPPTFPVCINPQGTIVAKYDTGKHGIVGDSILHEGADTVYQLSNTTFMQCFCPPNGQGVQTNWWNVANLDQSDIQSFISNGWMYQPQGLYWGLTNAPFLAQNANFTCNNQITAVVESANETNKNPQSGGGNNQQSNTPTQLAPTGNIVVLYGLLLIGALSIIISLLMRKNK